MTTYQISINATVEFSGDADDLERDIGIGLFDKEQIELIPRVDTDKEQFEVLDYNTVEVSE